MFYCFYINVLSEQTPVTLKPHSGHFLTASVKLILHCCVWHWKISKPLNATSAVTRKWLHQEEGERLDKGMLQSFT